jgi:adenylate cyclase
VIEMLNRYWAAAVPAVVTEGGFIERFAGDAIIVAFNAVTDQSDHALRAARAALAIRSVTDGLAADLQRSFTVIGDTINLAARLQATAQPGEVVIGPTMRGDLRDRATVIPLGAAELRGRRQPVSVYRLVSVAG